MSLQVFKHYFEELEEESLRDNFVVVVRKWILAYFFQFYLNYFWFNGHLSYGFCSMSYLMK